MNKTNIVLIPKTDNPETINQFRPIGLCNVSYKVVSKIIVYRIRPLLDNIISPFQSSFIHGRQTSDIICQEIIHTLKNSKSKTEGMIWKIDFDKAYDRISWDFLLDTLRYFNFNEELIALIMSCVTTVEASILWNGEPLNPFRPLRGLRQGDPLSPYLFVLCMERLSAKINQRVSLNQWVGIKASKEGPCLSHLFFADYILFFGVATLSQCDIMKDTLDCFCEESGQLVSAHKSKIFVSPNTPPSLGRNLSSICGFSLTKDLGMYLGVPLIHSKVSKRNYQYIIERLSKKLVGWKADSLNLMGRATLVKYVTSTIPYYTMLTTALPTSITNQIDKINRNFLWGDKANRRKVHLVNWSNVCKHKKCGGLGIRKVGLSNVALLSKLGWRISSENKPLWIQVLKKKYLKNHNLRNWPTNKKASHTWRSIIKVRDFTVSNIKWIVGDGNAISFWHDWWCGDTSLAENGYVAPLGEQVRVKEYINEDNTWNTQLISQALGDSNVSLVTNTLLPRRAEVKDVPCWVPNSKGTFSVKSAYEKLAGVSYTDTGWGWILKIKVPAKLQGFLWTCMHGKLLTNQHRKLRGLSDNDLCPLCGSVTEDLVHLFFDCPSSANIWSRLPHIQVLASGDIEDWRRWLKSNINQPGGIPGGLLNPVLNLVTLWNI